MNSDMLHVIDDATSAMHDAYDDTTSMVDNIVPLGEFLDEQLARARRMKLLNMIILMKVAMKTHLLFLRVMFLKKKLL